MNNVRDETRLQLLMLKRRCTEFICLTGDTEAGLFNSFFG
jgi:hypothetical protein